MIYKLRLVALGIVFGWVLLSCSACSASETGSSQAASQLAAAGKTVYQQNCAKCHGENGQKVNGSALMGQDNVLAVYQTGQMLYDYISKNMPDDNPGGLSPTQYLAVENYLLLQDGYVKPDIPLSQNNLDQILLENH